MWEGRERHAWERTDGEWTRARRLNGGLTRSGGDRGKTTQQQSGLPTSSQREAPPRRSIGRHTFSKVLTVSASCSRKCTRALTYENFWQANRGDHGAVYLAPLRYQAVRMLVKLVMQKTSPSGVTLGPMIVVKGGACEGKSVLLAR